MQLHKTSGIPAGKPELLSKNTHPMAVKESSGATKSAKASAALPKTFVSSLIAAAGLPADKLSSSIVSFVRFFSLPIKKEVLLDIRRQVFAHPTAQTAEERTTLSMAAAAAESKGVELHQKGLELYAEAVDPKWRERQNSGGQNKQHNNRQNQQNDDNILSKPGSINSSSLEKIALEYAEKDPLLSILNRLPGKNGQRWIVLPFEFNEKNRQFRMSLRILLEEKKQNHVLLMALDIVETGNTKEKRSCFIIDTANNHKNRLSVFMNSNILPKDLSSLKGELSSLLDIPPEHIFIKAGADDFPFEADSAEETFTSIDEAF